MPKDRIATTNEEDDLHVGWTKDGGHDIQLGVGIVGGKTEVDGEIYDNIWVHLDRHGINALIRTLRRARDATFGSDA